VSCNSCWAAITEHRALACDNNPRVGAADEVDWWPPPAPRRKRVVVVGTGIAGLEAAWIAAARGHDVIAFGAGAELGGKTRLLTGCRAARA
jgi:NADPH-dependent 2,4-dienoyl-CoA reductase/sulfur reductase-like enzyme